MVSATLPRVVDRSRGARCSSSARRCSTAASTAPPGGSARGAHAPWSTCKRGSTHRAVPPTPPSTCRRSAGACSSCRWSATTGEGHLLRSALATDGVSTEHLLTQSGHRTIAKHRVTVGRHMLVRFDQGSAEPVGPEIEQRLIEPLGLLVPQCHAIVVSDYGYGVCTPGVGAAIARLPANRHHVLVADAGPACLSRGARDGRQAGLPRKCACCSASMPRRQENAWPSWPRRGRACCG